MKEDMAKFKHGYYQILLGLVLLGVIISIEYITGEPLPYLLDILCSIGFGVFIITIALYHFFLYIDNSDE